jgi:hypothetical protein
VTPGQRANTIIAQFVYWPPEQVAAMGSEAIADAIREAVAAERARCLIIAETAASEWLVDIAAGSQSASLLQGMADGANIVARRIREANP